MPHVAVESQIFTQACSLYGLHICHSNVYHTDVTKDVDVK